MCGRYSFFHTDREKLTNRFQLKKLPSVLKSRYNIAPSQKAYLILNTAADTLDEGYWGFLPHWRMSKMSSERLINARAETVHQKSAFCDSFQHKRCLILADGFYEWKKSGQKKQPYYICLKTREPFTFAGIWAEGINSSEGVTFAIMTTSANDIMRTVHDRMPVILSPDSERKWLDPSTKKGPLSSCLNPYPANEIQIFPISNLVNSPTNDTVEILTPTDVQR